MPGQLPARAVRAVAADRRTGIRATRRERREHAREHRRAVEEAQLRAAALRTAWRRLAAVALAAVLLTGVLVAVTEATLPGREPAAPAPARPGLLAGIASDGYTLGDPDAPVTLVEFIDMQCPYCARFDQEVLPAIVRDYVRPGKVKLELRTLAFIGPDSRRAAEAVAGAAEQDRAWAFADRFLAMQGAENAGYVTEDFLRAVGGVVPGLDVERALAASSGGIAIGRAEREANSAGIDSTPSFLLGRSRGTLERVDVDPLDAAGFRGAIDAVLP